MNTWRATWLQIRSTSLAFVLTTTFFILAGVMPLWFSAVVRDLFDRLTTGVGDFGRIVITLALIGICTAVVDYLARVIGFYYAFFLSFHLRRNLFERVFELPAAQALITAPGEMISRFSGDAREVRALGIWTQELMMNLSVVIISTVIMLRLNPRATLWAYVPLLLSVLLINVLRRRVQRYRSDARKAEGSVTGFIGEIFGAVQAVKVADAGTTIDRRFRELNQVRHHASLRDALLTEAIDFITANMNNISIGFILLVIGGTLGQGGFSVGDFALFVGALLALGRSLTWFANWLAVHERARVSLDRMQEAMQGSPPPQLLQKGPWYLSDRDGELEVPVAEKVAADRLTVFSAENLTFTYPTTSRGIEDVSLTIPKGSFTVIIGRIGSGKSTLVRALLGLLKTDGTLRWNGNPIDTPDTFMTPPRVAYTPQVPRLVSESLADNILMGLPHDPETMVEALHSAVLDQDIDQLEEGLETMVGTRGMKLSGGQIQRAAATRMFVRRPELYVFDDLSSALDVNTERILWDRLFTMEDRPTCVVVSHRRPALQRADQIVVMKFGRIDAIGTLEQLLKSNEEIRTLIGEKHDDP